MKAYIPYGRTKIPFSHRNLKKVLVPKAPESASVTHESQHLTVLEAMKNPIGSQRLSLMAKDKKHAVIIISDHTRPVPSRFIIPHMLEELCSLNKEIQITLLVATGCHRGTTVQELREKLGDEVVDNEKIVVHDCDESPLVNLGILPSGAELIINSLAVEADLLIAEGFIEPHFFAGFSGGRKSVLPGICSRKTVLGNHCSAFISSPYAKMGSLEKNPINIDMEKAARMAKLAYIVNVVIDDKKNVIAAFAGDPIEAHHAGCDYMRGHCQVEIEKKAEIVITSNGGAPLDQNIYQAVKGMATAFEAVADKGIIIMCAECADGTGGDSFYQAVANCKDVSTLLEEISKVPMDQTPTDQWEYQILARILEKHEVLFVTEPSLSSIITDMKMEYFDSLDKAVDEALRRKGKDADIVVIPNGVSVIVNKV